MWNKLIANNKVYYPVLLGCIIAYSCANFHNLVMSGIWPYYNDYAGLIHSGFSSSYIFKNGCPTFPMWGYGFIFALTQGKALIIFLQQALSIITISQYLHFFEKKWTRVQLGILKTALLFSFPLFFYNTAIAPYSIGSSMLLLGILYLVKYLANDRLLYIVCSAVAFGIMLNFRSDYFYFLFLALLTAIFVILYKKQHFRIMHFGAWAATIFIIMVPWMLYTNSKTGKYLFTSTNSGHQLYMSLGQYPGNPWGIQKGDNSPQMLAAVQQQFGTPKTLTYEADLFLQHRWLEEIKKYPSAFIKKMAYSCYDMCKHPFYIGDIYARHETAKNDLKHLLSIALNMLCRILFLSVAALLIWRMTQRKFLQQFLYDPLLLFSVLLIAYQVVLQSVAYSLFLYNTGIYFVYLIVLVYVWPLPGENTKQQIPKV